jgi:Zn-dependent peptidase ImmA (M78 family)
MKNNINVGSKDYTVNFTQEDKILAENETADGYINYTHREIVIRTGINEELIKENVIHEILHALLDDSGIENTIQLLNDEDKCEALVSALSPRIYQFIKDNKTFIDKFIL